MKRILLTFIVIALCSCGASKTVRQSKKVIKGDWFLQTITYNQSGSFNVKLLNDSSKECFENSTWQFIPNNNTGSYILDSDCASDKRFFIFTIKEVDEATDLYDFTLKPTDEKKKSEINNSGFRLKLTQLSDATMQWRQTVSVDGKPFTIDLNFTKL